MGISNVISLLSGIALFLFGMALMGDGLKQVAGNKLELILYRLTGNPIKGFLLGAGVTAVIQSSSATSVMIVGFVNSGMMKVRQAISIVLGAILGTSITGWIICLSDIGSTGGWLDLFSTATLTGVISVIGIVLRMAAKDPAKKHIGDILMGFAVLMFGMSTMSAAVSPLREDPTFIRILTSFSNPFLGILFGTLFTCVLQSASAAVGILQALASTGIIDFSIALPIIMGIAIGAAMPVLLSAIGASVDGKRTAMVYLVAEVTGVILFAAIYYTLDALIRFPFADRIMTSVSIAFVNTVFRFIKVVALLPFTKQIEKTVNFLVRDKPQQKEVEPEAMRLEERFIQHPALAIEQSRLTINAMAEEAKRNFVEAVALLHGYSDERFKLVEDLENSVDRYEDKLGTYLVKVTEREMTVKQNAEVSKFLHTISDFERISDHAYNIMESAEQFHNMKKKFSDKAKKELRVYEAAVKDIVDITFDAYDRSDIIKASRVEPLEEVIDRLNDEIKKKHIKRLRKGKCTIELGFVLSDLTTNFERVADHCSNIAVCLIQTQEDGYEMHEYLDKLKEDEDPFFEQMFEEYRKEYRLPS